jgi:hypothetical protein
MPHMPANSPMCGTDGRQMTSAPYAENAVATIAANSAAEMALAV